MQIIKGSRRVVILFPYLGFVIKFPKFLVLATLKMFFWYCAQKSWKLLKKWFRYDLEVRSGFKDLMYKGIHDNWHEYKFFIKTRNVFLQPTYFSFFGLVNIQRYGESQKLDLIKLSQFFGKITNYETIEKDGHHFGNFQNFCIDSGKIRILDYGSKKTQEIILKWGEKIVAEFESGKLLDDRG